LLPRNRLAVSEEFTTICDLAERIVSIFNWLTKEKRIAAWKKAVEKDGRRPVTAKLVREAVVKYRQKKAVDNSGKKLGIDKSIVISVLRLIEDTEEALKTGDLSKVQKILQRMQRHSPKKSWLPLAPPVL
jgi:hypothetical protein